MLAALFVALVSAQTETPVSRTCTASATDSVAVATALRTWYAAEAQGDAAKFHSLVTPDFFIFDGGRRMTADSLLEVMQSYYAKGGTATWTISDPQVVFDCTTALATFTTHGVFRSPTSEKDRTWLESAALRKTHGQWQIYFFQSCRIPDPPAAVPDKQ